MRPANEKRVTVLERKTVAKILSLLTMAAMLFASNSALAARQTIDSGSGLRVSPVRTDLTIKPGQTKTVAIDVTNVTAQPTRLQVVINDFMASGNETGQPKIILDPNQYAPSHSLKRFVEPISSFTLKPGQVKEVDAVIKIPANAAGGGYYGAVRFAPASVSGGKNITLSGSVGSLILVKVPGDIKEQLSIASFDVRKNDSKGVIFLSNKSLNAVVRFQNEGNIQEEPFGKILLKDRSGKVLSQYEINNSTPRGDVLPDSIRRFATPLTSVGTFGKYTLEGNFGYGSNGQLLSAKTTFYVVPLAVVLIAIVAVLLILFAIFVLPRLIKSYNRRIIRRASRM